MAKNNKKNKIEVKLIKGNNISKPTPPDMRKHELLVKRGSKPEESKRPALLISRLDHAVSVHYGDSIIRVSPRSSEKVGDVEKIDQKKLPKGIFIKKIAAVKVKK